MFESILFKILQRHLSDYLLNIDVNNLKLGVWSGNISIENVAINPKIFERLSLPIRLQRSTIGKVMAVIPWNRLLSQPVELILENLLIILVPVPRNEWKKELGKEDLEEKSLEAKKKLIESIRGTFMQKVNKEYQKGSYVERVARLIRDNLQIKIKDIHVRFESEDFAFGIKINFFSMITATEEWKEGFLDRSEPSNRSKPSFKLVRLDDFQGYWSCQQKNDDLNPKNRIFLINAAAKYTHNLDHKGFSLPKAIIQFEIRTIESAISKYQLKNIIKFLEFLALYSRFLRRISPQVEKIEPKELNEAQEKANFEKFHNFFIKRDCLNESQKMEYRKLLIESSETNILKWTKITLKESMTVADQENVGNQGWFSWLWWSKKEEYDLSAEERKEVETFLEENKEEEINLKKPEDYVYLQVECKLEGGTLLIYYENEKEKNYEEGVRFGYKGLSLTVKKNSLSQFTEIDLREAFIEMLRISGGSTMTCEFLTRNDFSHSLAEIPENLIQIRYRTFPPLSEYSGDLEISVSSSKIIYNPLIIKSLKEFFSVEVEDQELRESALEKLHEIESKTQSTLEESLKTGTRVKASLTVKSPAIIVPFLQNNSLTNECWVLQSGDLSISHDPHKWESKQTQEYELKLSQIKLEYFSSLKRVIEFYTNKNQMIEKEQHFCLIKEFEITATLKKSIKSMQEAGENPIFDLEVSLASLTLNLAKPVYKKLQGLKDHLSLSLSEETDMEIAHNERLALLKKAVKIGEIYKQTTSIGVTNWQKFFCVLSGNYLYFFINQKDINPHSNFYLKNSQLFEKEDKIKGNNVLYFRSRTGDLLLAFDKTEQKSAWINTFSDYYQSVLSDSSSSAFYSKKIPPAVVAKNFLINKMVFLLRIPQITMNLFYDVNSSEYLSLTASEASLEGNIKESWFYAEVALRSLEVKDSSSPLESKNFINNKIENNQEKMIKVKVQSIGYEHPDYKGVNLGVSVQLGVIQVNYNGVTMTKIVDFFGSERTALSYSGKTVFPEDPSPVKLETNSIKPHFSEINKKKEAVIFRIDVALNGIEFIFCELEIKKQIEKIVFQISLKKAGIEIQKQNEELAIKGQLGNLQVIEKTHPDEIELLGLLEEKNSSLCEFRLKSKSKTENSLEVSFDPIKIDLMMPSFGVILGYLSSNLINLLQSKNVGANAISAQKKKSKFILKSFTLDLSYPTVIIRPKIEDSGEFLQFNLGKIRLQRDVIPDKKITKLFMHDIDIFVSRHDVKEELLKPFNLNFCLSEILNEVSLKALSTHFILNIKRSHLIFLQRLCEENLLYSFQKGGLENPSSLIQSAVIPMNRPQKSPKIVDAQFDFESINIFFIQELGGLQIMIPLCLFMFKKLRAAYIQSPQGKSFKFRGMSLVGSYFIFRDEEGVRFVEEYSLFGQISRKKMHNIEKERDCDVYALNPELTSATFKSKEFEMKLENQQEANFAFNLFEDEKNTEVNLKFSGLQINLMFDILMEIGRLFDFKDISEKSAGLKEKIFKKEPSTHPSQRVSKNLKLRADFKDCCLSLSCSDNHVMKILGEISIHMNKHINELEKNEPLLELKFKLKGCELFLCEMEELILDPPEIKRKRGIFLPFDLNVVVISEYLEKIKEKSHNVSINLDHFIAEICYKDILILKKTFENQMELIGLFRSNLSSAPHKSHLILEFKSKNLNVLLINDVQSFFAPFLYLKLRRCDVFLLNSPDNVNLELNFAFKLNYFNFFASCWEPIIETVDLKAQLKKEGATKALLITQLSHEIPLNVNISTQMIDLFLKNKDLITRDIDQQKNQNHQGKSTPEFLNLPSLSKLKSKQMLIAAHQLSQERKRRDTKDRIINDISPSVSFDQGNCSQGFNEISSASLISRHAVRNLTGLAVEIDVLNKVNSQKINIVHGQFTNIFSENTIEYKEILLKELSFEESKNRDALILLDLKVRVSISQKNEEKRFTAIKELSLDRVTAKRNTIYPGMNPNSQCAILSKVVLHARTNTKVLTLSSPIILRNLSRKNIEIKFLNNRNFEFFSQNISVKLADSEEYIVPVDRTQSIIVFRVSEDITWSSQISLEKLQQKEKKTKFVKLTGDMMISIGCENSAEFPQWQKIFSFNPCFSVKNYLPFPIEAIVSFPNKKNSLQFNLNPEEACPFYQACEEATLCFHGKNFEWTNNLILFSKPDDSDEETYETPIEKPNLSRRTIKMQTQSGENSLFVVLERSLSEWQFFIYAEVIIYNNTPFELQIFGKNSDNEISERQRILPEDILASFAEMVEINKSGKDILLSEFSAQSMEVTLEGQTRVELIIETKPWKLEETLSSTVLVVILGKFILCNHCSENIFLKQSESFLSELGVQERQVLTWSPQNLEKKVSFSIKNSSWSGNFKFTELGVYYFTLIDRQKVEKRSFKIQTILTHSVIVSSMTEIKEENGKPYLLSNEIDSMKIFYRQKGLDQDSEESLKPLEKRFYIPDRPDLENALIFQFYNLETKETYLEKEFQLDSSEEELGEDIICERIFTEKQMKLTFKVKKHEEKKRAEQHGEILNEVVIRFTNVGLSFIFNTGGIVKPPYELCYFSIRKIEFCLHQKSKNKLIQFKLGDLALENTSPSKFHFPLVISKTKEKDVPILNIFLDERKTEEQKMVYLNTFKVSFDDLSLTLEKQFILLTTEYVKEIIRLIRKYKEIRIENKKTKSEEPTYPFNLLNQNNITYWQIIPFKQPTNNLYVKEFVVDPVLLRISYKTLPQSQETSIKNFFKSLQNIDNADFRLTGLKLPDYFDNKSALLLKFWHKIKEELYQQISFLLLGNVEILGNPIGLFNHISAGVTDLIEKPIEGLIKGPLDAGKGLLTGVSSFMRNTLFGTFNSVDKISSSLGSSLAALSFDQDYVSKKQGRTEREAEDLLEGLSQATNVFYKGIENGITGVFLNPLEGAKEEGVSGLLKGTLFGLTGFFLKPISAIFDATSKTASSLKNTVNQESQRKITRYKRPFYGVEKFYKEYSNQDGMIFELIQKFKKGKYAKLSFFDFFKLSNDEDERTDKILVIMVEVVFLLSVKKKRKDWEVETQNLRKVESLKGGVWILFKEKIKKLEDDQVFIPIPNEDFRLFITRTIRTVMELSKSLP